MNPKRLPYFLFFIFISFNFLNAQWVDLGSDITASPRIMAGISIPSDTVIWGFTWNTATFGPTSEFTRTTDGGQTWQPGEVTGIDPTYVGIYLFALDDQTAWLTTADELDPISGSIYKTVDGGAIWVEQTTAFTGFNETPAGVYFWDENKGFSFGATSFFNYDDQIAIYTTENGGDTWTKVVAPNMPAQLPGEGFQLYNFEDYFSVVGDTCWFGTTKGRMFRSTDRGTSWEVVDTPFAIDNARISSTAFKNNTVGLTIALNPIRLSRSLDGGANWTELPLTVPSGFFGAQVAHVAGTRSTWMLVGGPGNYAVSYNDGNTWEFSNWNIDAWSVKFLDPSTGFAGSQTYNPTVASVFKWNGPVLGNRLFVNDDATGANNGTSWTDAFNDLQDALAIAQAGDQIWVAEGHYQPAAMGGSEAATYLVDKDILLYGGFAATEERLSERGNPADFPTILSGDLNGDDVENDFETNRGDNVRNVMIVGSEVTNAAVIDGFIFQNGHADGTSNQQGNGGGLRCEGSPAIVNCQFRQNFAINLGGGVSLWEISDTIKIENCSFDWNLSNRGGGIDVRFCTFIFDHCEFTNNIASATLGQPSDEIGGGIFTQNSFCTIRNCSFSSNFGSDGAGGIFYWVDQEGAGFSLLVDSCLFNDNSAEGSGAALYSQVFGKENTTTVTNSHFQANQSNGSFPFGTLSFYHQRNGANGSVLIDQCVIEDNSSTYSSGGIDWGSGTGAGPSEYRIRNSQFFNNSSPVSGGALSFWSEENTEADFYVEQCLFEGNQAGANAGAIWVLNGSDGFNATIDHCKFINNSSPAGAAIGSIADDLITPATPTMASLKLDNCLIAENSGQEAAISIVDLLGLDLINCTVANNDGSALLLSAESNLTLQNTVLYNPNYVELQSINENAVITSNGGNLIFDNSMNAYLTAQDQSEIDPVFMMDSLAPAATSPLVNAGVNDGVAEFDLAGNVRIQEGTVDIGAYESPFATSIKEVNTVQHITLSPNPATHEIWLNLPESHEGLINVQILDASGKLLEDRWGQSIQPINIEHLASGVYFVKVNSRNTAYVGKFLKG